MATAWVVSKRAVPFRSISRSDIFSRSISTHPEKTQINQPLYISPVDAEPLHRYRQGGYHPVTLGECLKSGRYKVLHKLGWGGYSTVWVARDLRDDVYVAVKICVAEMYNVGQELNILKKLAFRQPRLKHTVHPLDNFDLKGPNGSHNCLVYELLGPNIPDTIDAYFPGGRLSGKLAKIIAKQSLIGLNDLHQMNIAHGDLHTRNLAFTIPYDNETEQQFTEMLRKPEIGHVRRRDGKDLEPGIPRYIVRPTSYWMPSWNSAQSIKIVDFGGSFLGTRVPQTLHTPLPVRAPEVIFQDHIDYRVDLWSMGCMLFELFVSQPPFDTVLITPPILVNQMREMASDDLPERWHKIWETMKVDDSKPTEGPVPNLQEWLEELYFDSPHSPDLTKEDIARLGQIIESLLLFEPSARASAKQVLDNPWFNE
ncbi:hypothetical protein ACN38_g1996 [Penicillium nordicum]|uniref:non-specific serine/threonine protein kinase n=1 Tax=Penicillium nordicum TaxID=229535 RepID=A0A0M8PAP4_9EURO|nr:hypothetical protein ACN38_g1996 [Penicillium nordicum]